MASRRPDSIRRFFPPLDVTRRPIDNVSAFI